jgi:hypothetical protein
MPGNLATAGELVARPGNLEKAPEHQNWDCLA